jgi:hypothetical protein
VKRIVMLEFHASPDTDNVDSEDGLDIDEDEV